jgi:hypothetical protein
MNLIQNSGGKIYFKAVTWSTEENDASSYVIQCPKGCKDGWVRTRKEAIVIYFKVLSI